MISAMSQAPVAYRAKVPPGRWSGKIPFKNFPLYSPKCLMNFF